MSHLGHEPVAVVVQDHDGLHRVQRRLLQHIMYNILVKVKIHITVTLLNISKCHNKTTNCVIVQPLL